VSQQQAESYSANPASESAIQGRISGASGYHDFPPWPVASAPIQSQDGLHSRVWEGRANWCAGDGCAWASPFWSHAEEAFPIPDKKLAN